MTASEHIYHLINDNHDITGIVVCKKICDMLLDEEIFKNYFFKFKKNEGIYAFCKIKDITLYVDIYLDPYNYKTLPDLKHDIMKF